MKLTKDELKILKNCVKYSVEHQTGKHFLEASALLKEIHRMEQAGEVENGKELQPFNHELDSDVAIYTNRNNLAKQMILPSFTYAVGRIVDGLQ